MGDEIIAEPLPVRGAIPPELDGVYLRNGPNPAFRPLSYTFPFDGDGMLHALRLRGGRAAYRNRFVLTPGLRAERRAGRALYGGVLAPRPVNPALTGPDGDPGPFKNTANTNIVRHAGHLLALWEGGPPTELAENLDTTGPYDFGGALPNAMTAHPKFDPATGEMLAFRYAARPPYLVFSVIDAAGRLVREVPLDIDAAFMVHDFAVTAHHAVLFLCPVVLDIAAATRGGRLLDWQSARGTRIGVLPRDGGGKVRWFEAEPFSVFHFMNAHERDGAITVDYLQHAGFGRACRRPPCLWRMRLDLASGTARRSRSATAAPSSPASTPPSRAAPTAPAGAWRAAPIAARPGPSPLWPATISRAAHWLCTISASGRRWTSRCSSPAPAPRGKPTAGSAPMCHDHAADASRFVLLDAVALDAPPVAEIILPRRVPHGFHGNWMAG